MDPSDTGPLIRGLLAQINDEVVAKLRNAGEIDHPGESGRARENVIRAALRTFIPDDFDLSTGFVIDARGNKSRQVDIVIHRRGYHPIFVVGGVSHFMVESVVAVIESKAAITSRAQLNNALDTIASVKRLDRSNEGTNYVLHGSMRGENVDGNKHQHQIHGSILTEASLARNTLAETMLTFLRANERRTWPNLYIDVHRYAGLFEDDKHALTVEPTGATWWTLGIAGSGPAEAPSPLVVLLGALANFVRVTPLVDYKPYSYFPVFEGQVHSWAIAVGEEPSSRVRRLRVRRD